MTATLTAHRLEYRARPWTLNQERRWHPMHRAAHVREWRTAFSMVARAQHVPAMDQVVITAQPILKSRQSMPDVAACAGAVKAAIDGLVDARVLADDSPEFVRELRFLAPVVGGFDSLVLTISPASDALEFPA